jgi:hypothetical protein
MTVNTESTSRKSLISTGEVELVEFFVQRPAGDDQDHEIARSAARALVGGVRNVLLTVTPLRIALVWWLAR